MLSVAVLVSVRAGVMLWMPAAASNDAVRTLPAAAFDGRALDARAFDGHTPDARLDSFDMNERSDLSAMSSSIAPPARVTLMPVAARVELAARPSIVDIRSAVYEPSQAGALIGSGEAETVAWSAPAALPDDAQGSTFFAAPVAQPAQLARLAVAEWLAALGLLALASMGVWQVRRPLLDMTRAAHAFASGRRCTAAIREAGPHELRRVVGSFNDMLRRRNEALDAQSAALAGLARHMENQAARLLDRALEVSEWHQRVALVEDIDAFADIAQQLLDIADPGQAEGQRVGVDSFLRDRYSMIGTLDQSLFICDLQAGSSFVMPRALLERLMTNLVDNALAHGAPPVEIRTARQAADAGRPGGWLLSVRDHGAGIDEDALASATQPFVRLNHTPRGGQHWGLGLAVVARLARRCGASLELGNHPDGGLWVRLVVRAVG
ncbi:sensor histidine kinase [Paraburkholderia sp. DHOC27]|nr:sensor histidine kinase [Paraburkholderia sp. DHOC27]